MRWGFLLAAFAAIATLAIAAPVGGFNDVYHYSGDLLKFYSEVSRHIRAIPPGATPTCDIANAQLPPPASQLPAVPAGQELKYVAVGRGTQVCSI
jgi:Protein of unknown function (DUF2990)